MENPKKKLAGRTVLVTGGAGFIGSHLVDHLLGYGANVICFDDLSTGSRGYVSKMRGNKRFSFVKGDVNEASDVQRVFSGKRIDYVFHYAALVGVQRTIEEPLKVLEDIDGIKNILECSRRYGVKKVVYASSSEVYGNQPQMPLHEDRSLLDVRLPYALVKSAGENYLRTYWEALGLPVTILRFFNVYGPRQESSRYGFVTGIFISQVLQGQAPTIFYDGSQTRDFMYVADNVEAAIQALVSRKTDGEALNVGTGKETSILELAKQIIVLNGAPLKPSLLHKRKLSVEVQRRVADVGKMRALLGFKPEYSLGAGLRKTYEWYRENPRFIKRDKRLKFGTYQKQVWVPKSKKSTAV
jgi:UDP-glucose 4-epimerase